MPSQPSTPRRVSSSRSGRFPRASEGTSKRCAGRGSSTKRSWAIEDCRDLSHHLEQALLTSGERVIRVAPKLMGASRRGEREPGKSDQIDARAIARAVLREGVERFPSAFLDEDAVEIRLLCDHRDVLVSERTRLINRLRINLVVLDPVLEAKIPSRKLDYPGQLSRITRRLRALPQTARVRIAREQTLRIGALTREQLSNVVDEQVKHQAATSSSVVVVSSSLSLIPSLNFTPSSTSATSSWPLKRRQRSWAASSSL